MVDAVCEPLQALPKVAPLQVYASAPAEADGPPEGLKSLDTDNVMVPPPDGVVRAL